MSGHGGAVAFRAYYERCTRQGQVLEDLSDVLRDGVLTWNVDQDDHHGELRCTCTPGGRLTALADYLKVSVDLAWADGTTVEREPLGQYQVRQINPTLDGHGRSDEIVAYDLVAELAASRITIPYSIPQGADPIEYIVSNLEYIGFSADQWAGPATARGTRATYPYEPGTSRQEFINFLLNGMGNYSIWMNRYGTFTSSPSVALARRAPVATYTAGDVTQMSTILPGAKGSPDYSGLCNIATVRNIVPGQTAIWYTAKNEDPSSPMSIQNRQRIARPPVDNSQITTVAEAQAQAELLVSDGAAYQDNWEIATHPDPFFDLHDVVTVNITASDGTPALAGNFWRRAFTFPLSLQGWQQGQRMQLGRVTPFTISGEGSA